MPATPAPVRRLLALTAAVFLVAVVAALGAGPTSANPVNGSAANGTYLALGDSVAFGYVPPNALPPPELPLDAPSFRRLPRSSTPSSLDDHVSKRVMSG
jgi:hypothetical protein